MTVIKDHTFQVHLPSGNLAVYTIQPQHVSPAQRDFLPELRAGSLGANGSLADRCIRHGEQLAHEKDGRWYKPGGWEEITDARSLARLENAARI
jgi:hypothetical protein